MGGFVPTGHHFSKKIMTSPNSGEKAAPYLAVLSVEGTDEHVVGDVVQVTSVLQPGACHGDVVSGALALGLDQHHGVCDLAANGLEGLQNLQPLAVWGHCYIKVALWIGCLVCLLTCTQVCPALRYRTQSCTSAGTRCVVCCLRMCSHTSGQQSQSKAGLPSSTHAPFLQQTCKKSKDAVLIRPQTNVI